MEGLDQDPLVSTDWLAAHLDRVRVLDATWCMPADGRDPAAEHRAARIPGAVFFDIDAVADTSVPLPHMLPSPDAFAAAVSQMGVSDDTLVVSYDDNGLLASARLWWTFRAFGHAAVKVLDGGLATWRTEGRPLDHGPAAPPTPAKFTPRFRPELVRSFDQVRASAEPVVDARPAPRFRGEAPEPRAALKSGHMPGALNVPHGQIVQDGRLKSAGALRTVFDAAGVPPAGPLTTTCGSGVTASGLALALARLGRFDVAVYDGSWSEWGARPDAPVTVGG